VPRGDECGGDAVDDQDVGLGSPSEDPSGSDGGQGEWQRRHRDEVDVGAVPWGQFGHATVVEVATGQLFRRTERHEGDDEHGVVHVAPDSLRVGDLVGAGGRYRDLLCVTGAP
jgi:hypothetical protein